MAVQYMSFQKKSKNRIPYIPGTKPSIQNAQLLTSSGIPSMDYVIGGGVPVGTTLLLEEDKYGSYAKLVAKYFLSEGIVCGHSVLTASEDIDCQTLIRELPAPVQPDDTGSMDAAGDRMTIAWRYQNLRTVESSPTNTTFGHNFDLTKFTDDEVLKKSDISLWSGSVDKTGNEGRFSNPSFLDLLCKIQHKIEEGQFGISENPEKRNLLRIAILSLGSPLWAAKPLDLALFCYCLRALLRSAYAVCLIMVPSHLYQNESVFKRCEHLCDISVRLESFAGSEKETNPAYKDYHGLFHINKLPAINTLAPHLPESIDLAFKLKRRKFIIEKLHLPPELQETAQREQDDLVSGGIVSCGGGGGGRTSSGGVPVGTTLLLEEDKYGSYAKLVAKYFLSEGIVCGHSVLTASEDIDCQTLIRELPAPVQPDDMGSMDAAGDRMTIAWRYQNLRTVESSPTNTTFGHNFDLTKFTDDEVLKKSDISLWSGSVDKTGNEGRFSNPSFLDLLCKIQHKIEEGQFGISENPEKRNLLRIAILSLGSPLWAAKPLDLALFCYCLRALLRSAYAVCLIMVPSHLYQNESVFKRCEHLCDISVRLESFAGSEKETNPAYKDYHGLFHINKLPAINTLAPHLPESIDLAFKLKRRKFIIEKLHLPP